MSDKLTVEIKKFPAWVIKWVMGKKLRELRKDLIREEFDSYFATKIYNLFGGDKKYLSIPNELRNLKDKIEKEKLKPSKDKIKIIQLEKELDELEDLQVELKELHVERLKRRGVLIRNTLLVNELEDLMDNPLKIYDEIK